MQEINQQKAEAFAERMIGTLNEGAIAIMTSIGHRTGLFDAMSGLPYSTSEEIADAANLNERYVREWLGAMTVGGIVGGGVIMSSAIWARVDWRRIRCCSRCALTASISNCPWFRVTSTKAARAWSTCSSIMRLRSLRAFWIRDSDP